ncbi:MAG: SRPBCC family protein [Caulobacteraceae bacterium]
MADRIEKTVELNAPIARVWRALTDPAEFGEWFKVKLDDPFMPGRPTRGHITHPGYEHVTWESTTVTMDEPRLFSFTWHPYAIEAGVDYSGEPTTLVEFKLAPMGERTRLTIVESGFDALPEHRRDEAFRMNEGGWAQQARNIKAHVER